MNHSDHWDRHEALLHRSAANIKEMQQTILRAKELVDISKRTSQTCHENLRELRHGRSFNESDPIAHDMTTSFSEVMFATHARQPFQNMSRTTLIRNSMGLIKELLDLLREMIASNDNETFFELQRKIRSCVRPTCRRNSTIH